MDAMECVPAVHVAWTVVKSGRQCHAIVIDDEDNCLLGRRAKILVCQLFKLLALSHTPDGRAAPAARIC